MLNKLTAFIKEYDLIAPGDEIVCALSGGADSTALLFALYLLREKLDFTLKAAHFNHRLRQQESDRDEAFARMLCDRYDIPLFVGAETVRPGKKGLEAAAREARYAFFATLPGKIATAHTANDNAETVLMHLVRGTGLKGLGGIAPRNGNVIRPMLCVTRAEITEFLQAYCLTCVQDSSNDTDAFLRNRLRHHVMPLLEAENPKIAENLSLMALNLRRDEAFLQKKAEQTATLKISELRTTDAAVRSRIIERFLQENGVKEPEYRHIFAVERLIFSEKPSAQAHLPNSVTVERCYDTLRLQAQTQWQAVPVAIPGETNVAALGIRLICTPAQYSENTQTVFTVQPCGHVCVRPRRSGDTMRLPGGTKTLKKIFIDRKIPASQRNTVAVLADEKGVLAVCGIGVNLDRVPCEAGGVRFVIENIDTVEG